MEKKGMSAERAEGNGWFVFRYFVFVFFVSVLIVKGGIRCT